MVRNTTDTPYFGGKGELSLRGKFSGLLVTGDTSFYVVVSGSPLAFRATRDTPFFVRDFRAFRGENYNGHSGLET